MRTAREDLIPVADRLYPPPPGEEDSEQQTVWNNPTDLPVRLTLFVETPKPTPGHKPRTYDERHGTRTYTLGPRATKAIPAFFDRQIQQTQCGHTDCLQIPFDCRSHEEGHEKMIVGGYGPQLTNKGTQRAPMAAGFISLAPALDDVEARRKAAEDEEIRGWRERKRAEEREAAAADAKARATKEISEREERRAWEQEKEKAAAAASLEVEQERVSAQSKKKS